MITQLFRRIDHIVKPELKPTVSSQLILVNMTPTKTEKLQLKKSKTIFSVIDVLVVSVTLMLNN